MKRSEMINKLVRGLKTIEPELEKEKGLRYVQHICNTILGLAEGNGIKPPKRSVLIGYSIPKGIEDINIEEYTWEPEDEEK